MENPTVTASGKRLLSRGEFCALIAYMISLVALAIDVMLPVLDEIGTELGTTNPNEAQFIIGMLYVGLAIGQLLYGPVSDTTGRKPTIYVGLGIFMIGCVLSAMAQNFETMLAGRFLQGLGVGGPRIVAMSIVRDLYSGRAMAQLTSIIMGFFIVVPALAPALGQGILMFTNWRMIFVIMLILAILVALWLGIRQPETLSPLHRREFSISNLLDGALEFLRTRISLWYTIAAGIIYGAFYSYLVTSPQIFKDQFGIVDQFPIYFGAIALLLGGAGLVNASLVMRLGMRKLCRTALIIQAGTSFAFLLIAIFMGGSLTLPLFLVWACIAFFMMGLLFGNFNAIAMEPLGHIAGIGAALVGSLATMISMIIGTIIGQLYNETVFPLIGGFAILGMLSLFVMRMADRKLEDEIV